MSLLSLGGGSDSLDSGCHCEVARRPVESGSDPSTLGNKAKKRISFKFKLTLMKQLLCWFCICSRKTLKSRIFSGDGLQTRPNTSEQASFLTHLMLGGFS